MSSSSSDRGAEGIGKCGAPPGLGLPDGVANGRRRQAVAVRGEPAEAATAYRPSPSRATAIAVKPRNTEYSQPPPAELNTQPFDRCGSAEPNRIGTIAAANRR